MKRNLRSMRFAVVCAMTAACAAEPAEHVGTNSAAASGPALYLSVMQLPTSIYLGNPLKFWGSLYSDGTTTHNDVNLTLTVSGAVVLSNFQNFGYDSTWACTQDVGKTITISCHADSVALKDGLSFDLMPKGEGTISFDAKVTEGGVQVDSFHADTSVVTASGADLGVYAYGGGDVQLGQTVNVPFNVFNSGPAGATGAVLTLALTGPGKFVSAPPPGKDPLPPGSTCTFTDTTATCPIGALPAYGAASFNALVQTTGVGWVGITGSVSANEADPMSFNNTTSVGFNVFKPVVADLSVAMTATPAVAMFKKPLTYTIVVSNKGPDTASSPFLYDSLPSDLVFNSITTSQGSCKGAEYGYLSCYLGPIAGGASATVTLVATPTEGGTISNNASVYNQAWQESDPDYTNNYVSMTTTVRGPNPPVTTTSSQEKFDANYFAWAPCTNDFVILSGPVHYATHSTYNESSGRTKYESHNNTEGVTGTGYYTGISYSSKSVTKYAQTLIGGSPTSFDYSEKYTLTANGAAPDLEVHTVNHVTFGPDGTPKVTVTKYSYECK